MNDHSLFNICVWSKNYPSSRHITAANVVCKAADMPWAKIASIAFKHFAIFYVPQVELLLLCVRVCVWLFSWLRCLTLSFDLLGKQVNKKELNRIHLNYPLERIIASAHQDSAITYSLLRHIFSWILESNFINIEGKRYLFCRNLAIQKIFFIFFLRISQQYCTSLLPVLSPEVFFMCTHKHTHTYMCVFAIRSAYKPLPSLTIQTHLTRF